MAYGLPSRGQPDWDDELNNSIEALRGDVQSAQSDVTVAKSDAAYARNRADEVHTAVLGTADAATAGFIADEASATRAELSATFVRGINVLHPKYGVNADGTGDDTAGIQQALDEVSAALGVVDVYFPAGTYMVDAVNEGRGGASRDHYLGAGLRPKSGTRLHLAPDAVLKVIPNASPGYSCISIEGVDDVSISGGQILGDRATHDYTTDATAPSHEWGFGINIMNARDITIEGMTISGLTGDGIFVSSDGLIGVGDGHYWPSERVWIRNCNVDGSRRNNISAVGCEHIVIENCKITRAGYDDGIKDGTAPRCGIDIENYGEGSTDYQLALKVTIRGNVLEENVTASIMNFNAYQAHIVGNYADNTISFGYATEAIVEGNVVVNLSNTTGVGIGSNLFSTGEYDANTIVRGNIVMGFGTGIQVQRDDVLVTSNYVTQFTSKGIDLSSGATGVTVSANRLSDSLGATAFGIDVSGTTVGVIGNQMHNVRTGVRVIGSATVEDNIITQGVTGITVSAGATATIKGNVTDLPGHSGGQSYDITWANTSVVLCEANVMRNSSTYSISAANSTGKSRIIGNRIVDSTALNQMSLSGGRHEVIGNTFILNRTTGTVSAIILAGSSAKSLLMGNTLYNSNTTAYAYLVNVGDSAASNTRVIGNTAVTPTGTGSLITGTDGGTPVETGNNLVAA